VIDRIEAMIKFHKILFSVATAVVISTGPAFADGDAKMGKTVFNKCRACHALKVGKKKVAPSLHGIVGRKAGSESYFKYSKAKKAAGIEWTAENLDKYLKAPKKFIPKNKMPFGGL
jgi:cytochrome c2